MNSKEDTLDLPGEEPKDEELDEIEEDQDLEDPAIIVDE